MKKLILTILFATLFACHTTINIPTTNTTTMEKFDIETFNKNKTGNEWDITGEEIDIRRLYTHFDDTFTEIITHKKSFIVNTAIFTPMEI